MSQEQMTLPIGIAVRGVAGDRYIIEGLLGKGGFGAVYLVRNQQDKLKLFALKEIIDPSQQDREHFVFEGQVLMRLSHPALPHVYRIFENRRLKRVYMVMDYIRGQDLEMLRKGQPYERFTTSLTLEIMEPIVNALIYLHQQQPPIVHRDVKPANIILPLAGGEAMLVDFGIAKVYMSEQTTNAIRHGSPGYAALEQYSSGTNPRSDIYGLAATYYTLLTGVIPPDAITRASASRGIDPLKPAHELVPDIPEHISNTLQQAMTLSVDDRLDSVEAFKQILRAEAIPVMASPTDIHNASMQKPAVARSTTASFSKRRYVTRHSSLLSFPLLTLLTLLLLTFIGIAGISWYTLNAIHPTYTARTQFNATATAHTAQSTPTTLTSVPALKLYPQLFANYSGTISDIQVAKTKTTMQLNNVQEDQNTGVIHGDFSGLGLVGLFQGTITKAGILHFTVPIYNGTSTISFDGRVQVGGNLSGNYSILDGNGQSTGQDGLWDATEKA